ncbi:MAG: arsenate-mycothiol transferase ArsC [Thermoplasmatota archaeon]
MPEGPLETPAPTPPAVVEGPVRHMPRPRPWKAVADRLNRTVDAAQARLGPLMHRVAVALRLSADVEEAVPERLEILRAIADRRRLPRVLFVDGTNGARSQMAEAFALTLGLYAESAGTFPVPTVPSEVVGILQERKMDISAWRPKILVPTRMDAFDRVIVMGDVLPEPLMRHPNVERWSFPLDPAGFPLEGYRMVREQTERHVKELARRLAHLKTRRPEGRPVPQMPG